MPTLADISAIEWNIMNGNAKSLKVLYTIVFGKDVRLNRSKLKRFEGFSFNEESEEFEAKMDEIKTILTLTDLVSVCHILNIDYTGTEDEVRKRVVSFLCHIEDTKETPNEEEEESEDEEGNEDTIEKNCCNKEDTIKVRQNKDAKKTNSKDDLRRKTKNEDVRRKKTRNANDEGLSKTKTNLVTNINFSDDELLSQHSENSRNRRRRNYDAARRYRQNERDTSTSDDEYYMETPYKREDEKTMHTPKNDRLAISFRDMDGIIRRFNGKDGYPIKKWYEEFEELANLTGWTDLQKLIFAKQSLDGLAKTLIQSERGVTTWDKLKKILKEEFDEKLSSSEVHRLLMNRVKKTNETIQEYTLIMREIGNRAEIEPEVIIQYIIDGIIDDTANKVILYGAKTFEAFKEKMKLYTTLRERNRRDTKTEKKYVKSTISRLPKEEKSNPRCFGCGEIGHKSNDCPSKEKGLKCFKCNSFGHIAKKCTSSKSVDKETTKVHNIRNSATLNQISIKLNGKDFSVLVDTGAEVSLLREDTYEKIGAPNLNCDQITLSGIGKSSVKTKGSFTINTNIDNEEYMLKFHVVSSDAVKYDGIIGNNILDQADIKVTKNKVHIQKKCNENFLINIANENCVPCILANTKLGKKEGLLNPIDKREGPLHTLHLDHLGPLPSSNKNYKYLFVITDGFTKFTWIFPTKTTSTQEAIQKLQVVQQIFGNPARFITDRGTTFTSQEFKNYCEKENIVHLLITTGVPRGNGQVERMNQIIIRVLSKISIDDPRLWYKHVSMVQRAINGTFQRSIATTPFELMVGIKMRNKEDITLRNLIQEESQKQFVEDREEIRKRAKEQISKVQEENKKSYNKNRKKATKYEIGCLVAIKRTQFGTGFKIFPKFLGPYRVTEVCPHDRYRVERAAVGDGPLRTTTSADNMKLWPQPIHPVPAEEDSCSSEAEDLRDRQRPDSEDSSGSDERQEGRECRKIRRGERKRNQE